VVPRAKFEPETNGDITRNLHFFLSLYQCILITDTNMFSLPFVLISRAVPLGIQGWEPNAFDACVLRKPDGFINIAVRGVGGTSTPTAVATSPANPSFS
jgi:hypothetical protein